MNAPATDQAPTGPRQRAPLSLEQKASLTSGASFWSTTAAGEVPSLTMTDGPHGLRVQPEEADHLGLRASTPATCFPPAVALGATWDLDLAERVGAAIAEEAIAAGVAIVLGPGINIKRSPLCGRNFEYFSEDPLVAGAFGAALVRGLQSRDVGASLKHFAANNQETDRLRISADIDERPLHEIYLRAFERVVREAAPWTVMCSYNRLNGLYASQHRWLLTELLREAWGFDGLVVSDWGAVQDRVAALAAGLDLEMPSTDGRTDAEIVAAVHEGRLAEPVLDQAVERVRTLAARAARRPRPRPFDADAHHSLAREAAARAVVLLRNETHGGIPVLPLREGSRLAVIGAFAEQPRYQGAGSSKVTPTRVETPLEALRAKEWESLRYAHGFPTGHDGSARADELRREAVEVAAAADTAVVFVGLGEAEESEGYDRETLALPEEQLRLIDAIRETGTPIAVIVMAGSAVELPFAHTTDAVVLASLLGQGCGAGLADVLTGAVDATGRLTETFPIRLEDTPAFGSFPGEHGHARYGEGLLVGYRWYDRRKLTVSYPFGHGLSYTSFGYGEPRVHERSDGALVVTVTVTNTGTRRGREVVQLYVAAAPGDTQAPPRELKGFATVWLDPGESSSVEIVVPLTELAVWDTRIHGWRVPGGPRRMHVGASSRDLRGSVLVQTAPDVPVPLSLDSSVAELLAHPATAPLMEAAVRAVIGEIAEGGSDAFSDKGVRAMAETLPARRIFGYPGIPFTQSELSQAIADANALGLP